MTTRIPVTIEGNLTGDPEHGTGDAGNEYARLTVAVNDRRLNLDPPMSLGVDRAR